jgi:hypothetical protein
MATESFNSISGTASQLGRIRHAGRTTASASKPNKSPKADIQTMCRTAAAFRRSTQAAITAITNGQLPLSAASATSVNHQTAVSPNQAFIPRSVPG